MNGTEGAGEDEIHDDPLLIALARTFLLPLNLAVFALQIPLSFFNFFLLYRTSLLHRNLKIVLYAQSACFCCFALAHSIQICIILKIVNLPQSDTGKVLDALLEDKLIEAKEHVHPIILFSLQFGNLIGHALVIERVVATLWARCYENYKGWHFSISWFLPMFLFSIFSSLQQIMLHADLDNPISVFHLTAGNVLSNYLSLIFSLAEIIIFAIVGAKNLSRYRQWMGDSTDFASNGHNLSERYQLAENVRTARQLAPTMIFHFINILFSSILPILLTYQLIHDETLMDLIMILSLLSQSICNALIEYTIISRHSILRKNAVHILKGIAKKILSLSRKNRIRNGNLSPTMTGNEMGEKRMRIKAIETAIGAKMSISNGAKETDKHFLMLKNQWG